MIGNILSCRLRLSGQTPLSRKRPIVRTRAPLCPQAARSSRIITAIVVAFLFAVPLHAATPRETLLRYVPDKVGFCLVLNDLRGHGDALRASPFVEHFLQSPLGKALAVSEEIKQLTKFEQDIKDLIGLDAKQLRDDILGDAVVLAYRPGPPGKPEQEQGLILLHARDPKLLAKLIEQINAKQKESGDLKSLEEMQYKEKTYFKRTEKKLTNFYYLDGSTLLFTGQEDMLKEALDQAAAPKDAEAPVARRFRELGADKTLLSLWINPRTFDAALAADRANKNKTPAEIAFAKALTPYWKALDSIVITVALEKELKVRVGFQTRTDDLPASARQFLKEGAKASAVWSAIPEDALFAVGGRVDLPALFELLGEFMPEATRKSARDNLNRMVAASLGKKDFIKDVLPHVGPDFGLYLSAPPTADKAWFPQTVLAVRVGDDGEKPPFRQSVVSALDGYARAAVVMYNKFHPKEKMSLKTVFQGTREVKTLVNERGFPPGFQPALAAHEGYIVLASSPEALGNASPTRSKPAAVNATDEVPLVRVSFKELRRWLKERHEVLTPIMAEQNKLTPEEAHKRMSDLLAGLEFVDRLEVSQRARPGQVVFTLTLETAWPLRK